MPLTESSLIQRVNRKIQNAKGKLGGDPEMRVILNEALDYLRENLDLRSAKRKSASFLVYKKIYEYGAPEDLSFDKTIRLVDDKGLLVNLDKTDPVHFYNTTTANLNTLGRIDRDEYDRSAPIIDANNAHTGLYAVDDSADESYLLIEPFYLNLPAVTTAHDCDSATANGTWAVSNDASNIGTDLQTYKDGFGSIIFDSDGNVVDVTISVPDATAVDLSSFIGTGRAFLRLYFPTTTVPDSVDFRFGDDSSNYYEVSATEQQNGTPFQLGWNLVSFNLRSATTTGSPTNTSVNYFYVNLVNASATAQQGYRLNSIKFGLGRSFTLDYYSKFLVVDESSSARKQYFDGSGDTSVLVGEEERLLVDMATTIAKMNLREINDAIARKQMLDEKLAVYRQKYPSQERPEGFTYYNA